MKTPHALVKFALFALCVSAHPSFSAEPFLKSDAENIQPQPFETAVLKVFAAKDGKAIFRAYVVKWKDQEVIVSDPLAKSDYKEGDTISVLAMNHAFPQGKEPYRLLHFTVVPERR